MLADIQKNVSETVEFSTTDLIRSMLWLRGVNYSFLKHGKIIHFFMDSAAIVVSEWSRTLDTRTLFNIIKRTKKVNHGVERILLVAKELSGHARETVIRRNLPVILIPDNEIMSILDYL